MTPLRRLGAVQIGAGIVMAASSGDCARVKMKSNHNPDFFTDKAMSYSRELSTALSILTARARGKMNQK